MPELPEVEVVKKSLQKNIHHLTLKKVEIRNKYLRYIINEQKFKKMIKSKVLSVKRRSKYILINLNNDYSILIHLGMTGKIIIIDQKNTKHNTSFYFKLNENNPKHNHVIFKFSKNTQLVYNDVRKFGFIKIEKTKNLQRNSHFSKLGPEPLSWQFNYKYFKNKIRGKKLILKDLLMNQNFVSGLGNIYVNEAIFLSKLHPKTIPNDLTKKKKLTLISNIKKILKKAIKQGGSSIRDFNNTDGQEGNFQQFFYVYNRYGLNCKTSKCKGTIKRVRISNRSTFYCNKCQN